MGKRGLLAALLLVAAGCADAAAPAAPPPPLRLRAEIDRAEVSIYDPVTLQVRIDYAEGVVPELPEGIPPVEGLTLDSAAEDGPHTAEGRTTLTRTYVVHAERTGSYIVPPVTVPYTLPDGTRAEAATPRLFIDVRSVLGEASADLADLRPIESPVPIPRDYTLAAVIAACVAVAVVLAVWLTRWWLLRTRNAAAAAPPPVPAHQTALNALAALERGPLLRQDRTREYVYELTEIFRAYLEGRFGIHAVASTTEQLLPIIAATPSLPPGTNTLVRRFATEADPIKYAGASAGADVARTWTTDVRRYVEATRPALTLEQAA